MAEKPCRERRARERDSREVRRVLRTSSDGEGKVGKQSWI